MIGQLKKIGKIGFHTQEIGQNRTFPQKIGQK